MKELIGFAGAFIIISQACNDKNLGSGPVNPLSRNSIDFVEAAKIATPAVVHVNTYAAFESGLSPLEELFRGNLDKDKYKEGNGELHLTGSGSGVIISSDGYLVTSLHIIENAERIQVSLNDKRLFIADLVGIDLPTDLALLKINGSGFPILNFGDAEELQVGEWVVAIGNPFNLTSTVTAGIVSAKGRYLNIRGETEGQVIESFIQTDAALNPGNSGGALTNKRGQLIGINAAIASPTGVFAGYSFAIPSHMVQKVVYDIIEFGEVKRGSLGVSIRDLDIQAANENKLENLSGALVEAVIINSAAAEAGILPGDIIISIDGRDVESAGELQEIISLKRPGNKITLTYNRKGKKYKVTATLKGKL